LQQALKQIVANHGLLIYLQQEGRGIGLLNKMKAYALQDSGLDTVEANEALGFHADQRNYQLAAQVLHYWNIKQIRLLTNNPKKIAALTNLGIQVSERLPLEVGHAKENARYLMTKKHKLGHNLTF
jgi:GTP cyclohydrolase II